MLLTACPCCDKRPHNPSPSGILAILVKSRTASEPTRKRNLARRYMNCGNVPSRGMNGRLCSNCHPHQKVLREVGGWAASLAFNTWRELVWQKQAVRNGFLSTSWALQPLPPESTGQRTL